MTEILNFALKIKGGGREGGTCEVLRSCHPPKKIWNVHLWPFWRAENEIIVFLINEGLNRECCHGNKIFDIFWSSSHLVSYVYQVLLDSDQPVTPERHLI